ncbi:uncharacterized protein N7483_009049 [Penicillium malachiteum]|uniref:uncharacterized protein n=1 Tax=Penicillium malachiteum TaxID=1324776 RepID=UPI00254790DE|nr:uncharacterized protein N7483_009049 [Penicillium malachiteum]KAJ5721115.1 hypothetical protein N7483_009049 [Penicillium malachiteum]
MAAVATPKTMSPPTTHEALMSFSQNLIIVPGNKSTKMLEDGLPPAPPPSPVSFAVDSNGKASIKHEKIPSLSLE